MVCVCVCVVPEKNPYLPHGRSLDIPRGKPEGGLKSQNFRRKYQVELGFPLGKGVQNKKPVCGKGAGGIRSMDGTAHSMLL